MSGYYTKQEPYIDDYGIHVPEQEYVPQGTRGAYKCIMTKDVFVEAYNRWINNVGSDSSDIDDYEWMND
jgi:hypothetical protein